MPSSPDATFLSILESNQNEDELFYQTMISWVNGCQSGFPFPIILTYIDKLDRASAIAQKFTSSIEDIALKPLSENCVGDNFSHIMPSLKQLTANMNQTFNNATSLIDLIGCQKLSPLYVIATHDTLCTRLPYALFWLGLGLVVVSVFGMWAITLRAAWLEVEILNESTDSSSVNLPPLPMKKAFEEDKGKQYIKGVQFEDTELLSKIQRPLQKELRQKGDNKDCEDRPKRSTKNSINTEKHLGLTNAKSTSTMSWEKYPIKPFSARISSQKLWDVVSVADEAALKRMPPLSTDPSFRVY